MNLECVCGRCSRTFKVAHQGMVYCHRCQDYRVMLLVRALSYVGKYRKRQWVHELLRDMDEFITSLKTYLNKPQNAVDTIVALQVIAAEDADRLDFEGEQETADVLAYLEQAIALWSLPCCSKPPPQRHGFILSSPTALKKGILCGWRNTRARQQRAKRARFPLVASHVRRQTV